MDACPCKDCSDRSAECHGRCSAYISWKKKVEEDREKRNALWDLKDFFTKPRYRGRREVKR